MSSGQPAARSRQSFARSTMRIFDLSLGEMLWARRTLVVVLILAAPVCLALFSRVLAANGTAVLSINGERVGGAAVFGALMSILYVKFIVPAIGVFYGTSLIADEVDDKTITYLFTRPIPRRSIALGKYLAFLTCATSFVLPSAALVFLLVVPVADMAALFVPLLEDLGILAVGLAVYGALFLLAGVALKRPLLAGLMFAFAWEQLAQVMPGYLKRFTVAYYLQALSPHSTPAEEAVPFLQGASGSGFPAVISSLLWLAVALVVALVLAMRTIERREYVLEQ